ncbi:dienelactone hydrolase family protein [Flavobacterium sp. J372]|uniref:dienelactone hydrolase family protein n=1 Tax=Flavobacterium sp. J372 TaxID=2898436 RepID=UPI0021515A9A|nr:dienelactone hydrolase family protein [Flavobacterium sp. J372]MCR5861921.1 dienelactone hydrolase family protein [Flavobacterium sp. J372]
MKTVIITLALIMVTQLSAQLKTVDYSDGTQKLTGFSIAPAKKSAQSMGILILPAWMGIDDHSKEVAQKLATEGHYAFVADIYGADKKPADTKKAGELSGYYKSNYEEYQRRIKLALDKLVKSGANKDKIVVIGYCFGGTGALEATRGGLPVQAVVSFHGGLGKDEKRGNGAIKPKVLILHGADDPYVPQKDIEAFQKEMRDAKADWQMVYYANAVHAFTEKKAGNDNSKGAAYNEKADKRSWEHFMVLLDELNK